MSPLVLATVRQRMTRGNKAVWHLFRRGQGGYTLHDQGKAELVMADRIVPHYHNTLGVAAIAIGAQEFMCIGSLPPFDHPHIYIDMGGGDEAICAYCSTVYRFDPALDVADSMPKGCLYNEAP